MTKLRLVIEGDIFRDAAGRELTLRGINVAGDAKYPSSPNLPSHEGHGFFEGDDVSFLGRPFSIKDAHAHLSRLSSWGYNTIRYVFTWEAIEHKGPGIYDTAWLQHTVDILRIMKTYRFHVFMDPHQDVWSRFTGGSGAPLWTLYACGLDPTKFRSTQAALVQNTWPDPATFPKMIWATNYQRLACQVMFTLFFGGKEFAPKAIIDGKNIQDYLQDHFIGAIKELARAIHEAGDLEDEVVIGWESMNEPNRGLIGWQDLTLMPAEQKLKKGTAPTAWQAILTGSGRVCEVETWSFGNLGPYKTGTEVVDPGDDIAWITNDSVERKYGWHRDPAWILGECLWAQHGVWDSSSDSLLRPDHFARSSSGETIDYEYFTNSYFMTYYRAYSKAIRSIHPSAILFCQPPVLEIPPLLRDTADDDPKMVFSPHFYDGITLMTKKWNRYWNVDVFGILRGHYLTPAFAIKLGEKAIRNCFKDQLSAIRKEGIERMGTRPCIFTEIGIPYDMDNQSAYETGDYSSQTAAMDANHFALEGSGANGFALWLYMCANNHEWGDQWNGEDLSIFSVDDDPLPSHLPYRDQSPGVPSRPLGPFSDDHNSPSYSASQFTDSGVTLPDPTQLADQKTVDSSHVSLPSSFEERPLSMTSRGQQAGYRAAEAYIRPSARATVGKLIDYGFDLRNCVFTLTLQCEKASSSTAPTEIYLPEFHFPTNFIEVEVSSGTWRIHEVDGHASTPRHTRCLEWVHEAGQQDLKITGLTQSQRGSSVTRAAESEGYTDQCRQGACLIM